MRTFGRIFFSIAVVAFGLLQLVMASFVRLVPPLPEWVPSHSSWARLTGVVLVVAGLALLGKGRMARWAAAVLGVMIFLDFLFLHLPLAATNPGAGFMWTNPAKALAMLGGIIFLAATLPVEDADRSSARSSAIGRLFRRLMPLGPLLLSGFMILGGIQHFVYIDFVAKLVPAWVPEPRFWGYFTGVALIAGGVGILVPKTARLAATMSGIMIFLWVVLLHIPRALADLSNMGEASGVFEALAMSGIAFMLAARGRTTPSAAPSA